MAKVGTLKSFEAPAWTPVRDILGKEISPTLLFIPSVSRIGLGRGAPCFSHGPPHYPYSRTLLTSTTTPTVHRRSLTLVQLEVPINIHGRAYQWQIFNHAHYSKKKISNGE